MRSDRTRSEIVRNVCQLSTELYGGIAQLGEHLPCKQGVMSSNLIISTKDSLRKQKILPNEKLCAARL